MIHRSADARLLSALISCEKDYHKHISALLDASHASLQSLSAFAAASSPPLSTAVAAVAGVFAAADNAYHRYEAAIEAWRDRLHHLKEVEEDVSSMARDREILVTRLIKASKADKLPRSSNNMTSPSSSSVTLSLAGPKLTAAQAELQACEASLAARERELSVLRVTAVRDGLRARCLALVECAWSWGEMGKEGLRALDELLAPSEGSNQMPSPSSRPTSQFFKPLPDPAHQDGDEDDVPTTNGAPHSDLSITPSGSASQVASRNASPQRPAQRKEMSPLSIEMLHLSPPMAPESVLPAYPSAPPTTRSALGAGADKRRVSMVREETEEEEEDEAEPTPTRQRRDSTSSSASASSANIPANVTVVENPRFRTWTEPPSARERRDAAGASVFFLNPRPQPMQTSRSASTGDGNSQTFPRAMAHQMPRAERTPSPVREPRKRSSSVNSGGGFFSRLFHRTSPVKEKNGSRAPSEDAESPTATRGAMVNGKWVTRTDKNLGKSGALGKKSKAKSRAAGDSSDEESPAHRRGPWTHMLAGRGPDSPLSELGPTANGKLRRPAAARRSYDSDDATPPVHRAMLVSVPRAETALLSPTAQTPRRSNSKRSRPKSVPVPPRVETRREATPSPNVSPIEVSTPVTAQAPATKKARRAASIDSGPGSLSLVSSSSNGANVQRRASSGSTAKPPHQRQAAAKPATTDPSSLMSIVDDLHKRNAQGWTPDPSATLLSVRAPSFSVAVPESPSAKSKEQAVAVPKSSGANLARKRSARSEAKSPSESMRSESTVKAPQENGGALQLHQPIPGMKPLKSALRQSRTPSPAGENYLKVESRLPRAGSPLQHESVLERPPAPLAQAKAPPGPLPASTNEENTDSDDDDDAASISSYETGHEILDDAPTPRLEAPPSPTPPPPPEKPMTAPSDGSEVSASSASTVMADDRSSAPVRRKSVRLSLQPTFSATPPAFDPEDYKSPWENRHSDEEEQQRKELGWRSRSGNGASKDVWDDSGSEDSHYQIAKKLLSR